MTENKNIQMEGHILITDRDTGEVVLQKKNAINFINMSEAIALSLTNKGLGTIRHMVFGNGASTVSGIGAITYYPPDVNSADSKLHNQTYSKIVDATDPNVLGAGNEATRAGNFMTVQKPGTNTPYADIVVTCTLGQNEPTGQDPMDNATSMNTQFTFDEIGLVSTGGKLLTHVIFSPIQKSANRVFEIEYTIRVLMVA